MKALFNESFWPRSHSFGDFSHRNSIYCSPQITKLFRYVKDTDACLEHANLHKNLSTPNSNSKKFRHEIRLKNFLIMWLII